MKITILYEVLGKRKVFLDVSYILIKSLPKPKGSMKPKTLSLSKIYRNLTVYLYHRSPAQPVNCRPHWASLCRHPCVDQVEHFHFIHFIYFLFRVPCCASGWCQFGWTMNIVIRVLYLTTKNKSERMSAGWNNEQFFRSMDHLVGVRRRGELKYSQEVW